MFLHIVFSQFFSFKVSRLFFLSGGLFINGCLQRKILVKAKNYRGLGPITKSPTNGVTITKSNMRQSELFSVWKKKGKSSKKDKVYWQSQIKSINFWMSVFKVVWYKSGFFVYQAKHLHFCSNSTCKSWPQCSDGRKIA